MKIILDQDQSTSKKKQRRESSMSNRALLFENSYSDLI